MLITNTTTNSVEQRLGFKIEAENMALIKRSKDRDRLLDYYNQIVKVVINRNKTT